MSIYQDRLGTHMKRQLTKGCSPQETSYALDTSRLTAVGANSAAIIVVEHENGSLRCNESLAARHNFGCVPCLVLSCLVLQDVRDNFHFVQMVKDLS
jgi:hypothetical protein